MATIHEAIVSQKNLDVLTDTQVQGIYGSIQGAVANQDITFDKYHQKLKLYNATTHKTQFTIFPTASGKTLHAKVWAKAHHENFLLMKKTDKCVHGGKSMDKILYNPVHFYIEEEVQNDWNQGLPLTKQRLETMVRINFLHNEETSSFSNTYLNTP